MNQTNIFKDMLTGLIKSETFAKALQQLENIYKRASAHIETADEFGMDPILVKMLRPVFQFLYDTWWRVKVDGVKNIPLRGAAIIAANHSGMLPYDAVMLSMAVYNKHARRRNVRFLVADFVENFPYISRFIERSGGVVASRENGLRLLEKNELVCIFPEGTRGIGKLYSERYKLQSFGSGGIVKLAMKTGAPIVPCAILGAEDIHPILWKSEELGKKLGLPFFPVTPTFPLFGLLGLIPLPGQWKIIFGKPVYYKGNLNAAKCASELRARIQEMIDDEI